MFPIKDSTPRRSFPFINYFIIAANILVFLIQISAPDFEAFINSYAFIPKQFNFFVLQTYTPIFTSLFLHGGLFHLLSNMWFLRIFGDNVEDRMGHIPYFVFYLIGGAAATLTQYLFSINSSIPQIGASGAISAVAGAYFVLFRQSRVLTLIPIFFVWLVEIPVGLFLGYWFFVQLFSGIGSIVSYDVNQGGVAFFAHVGGFVFGYLLAKRLKGSS